MPPYPHCFQGLDGLAPLFERAFGPDRDGDWRLLPTAANRMPAAGSYLRRPGDTLFRPFKLDVLRVDGGVDRGDHDVRSGAVPRAWPAAVTGLTWHPAGDCDDRLGVQAAWRDYHGF